MNNVLFGLMSKSVTMILEFVSRVIFIQVLGVEVLGINSVFISVVQMLSLAELGITNAMVFSFYRPLARGNEEELAALVLFYRRIYLAIAAAVVCLGMLMIPFLPYVLQVESLSLDYLLAYFLVICDTAVSYLFVYHVTLIRADQRGYVVTRYEIVVNLIRTVAQIVVLVVTGSYVLYLLMKVIGTGIYNCISSVRAKRDYPYTTKKAHELEKDTKSKVVSVIKSSFIYKVSAALLNSSTNIIMSTLAGAAVVGYLTNYVTIITAISSISVVIFTNLTASVGNLAITESPDRRLSVFKTMITVGSILTIVFVSTTTVMSNSFVSLWIGSGYVLPDSTVYIRMAIMFLSCYMQPIFAYREAVGLYQKTKYIMLAAAVLNIVFSVVLGLLLGVDGILLASVLSCVCTYFWYEPYLLYREYFESSVVSYYKSIGLTLFLTVCISALGIAMLSVLPSLGWIEWATTALAFACAAGCVSLLVFHRTPEFKELKERIKTLASR